MSDEVAGLRRQLRLTWLGIAVVGLLGAAPPLTVLRTHRLEIIDRAGHVVATLDGEGGPRLHLEGPQGEVTVAVDAQGPRLESRRPQGRAEPLLPPPPAPAPATVGEPEGAVVIELRDGLSFQAVEVNCPDGFRARAAFVEGRAVVPDVPTIACRASLKGGPPVSTQVVGAEHIVCRQVGGAPFCKVE